jgi:hypothetical protein
LYILPQESQWDRLIDRFKHATQRRRDSGKVAKVLADFGTLE